MIETALYNTEACSKPRSLRSGGHGSIILAAGLLLLFVFCRKGFAAGDFLIDDDPGLDLALKQQMQTPEKGMTEKLSSQMWGFGPRMTLGYRWSKSACAVSSCPYHQFSIVFHPIAIAALENPVLRMIRLGIGIEGGGETTQARHKWWSRNHSLAAVISIGFQFPHRVTPFLDFLMTLGALHRNIYNKDLFHFAHSLGIEGGVTVFPLSRLYITAAVGWRRWVIKTSQNSLYYDSFTFMTGIGF